MQHQVWSIGNNECGQQADGTMDTVLELKLMNKLKRFNNIRIKNIVGGYNGSTYILLRNDNLIVIGDNYHGQLGVLSSIFQAILKSWYQHQVIPMDIVSLIINLIGKDFFNFEHMNKQKRPILIQDFHIAYISSGIASSHKFIIAGNLYGSGTNEFSQLGIKASATNSNSHSLWNLIRFQDINISEIKHISCADTYSTFLMNNGDIYTCGYSSRGGLGIGDSIIQLDHLKKINPIYTNNEKILIVNIQCGFDHSLAIDNNGYILSWGSNSDGQLGHGDDVHFMSTPTMIMYFKDNNITISNISCGSMHNVVLDKLGNVYCFGLNDEWQCGNYDVDGENVYIPEQITNNMEIEDIKAGHYHSVLKRKNNKYYLFGWNQYNQCLVINDKINNVIQPTLFDDSCFLSKNINVVAIYPGYKETRIVTHCL